MDPYRELLGHLSESAVRFLVVGVTGVNYYALPGQTLFATEDLNGSWSEGRPSADLERRESASI